MLQFKLLITSLLLFSSLSYANKLESFYEIEQRFLNNRRDGYSLQTGIEMAEGIFLTLLPKNYSPRKKTSSGRPMLARKHTCNLCQKDSENFDENDPEKNPLRAFAPSESNFLPKPVAILLKSAEEVIVVKKVGKKYREVKIVQKKQLGEEKNPYDDRLTMLFSENACEETLQKFNLHNFSIKGYFTLLGLHVVGIAPLYFDRDIHGFKFLHLTLENIPTLNAEERSMLLLHGVKLPRGMNSALAFMNENIIGMIRPLNTLSWSKITEAEAQGITQLGWPLTYSHGQAVLMCENLAHLTYIGPSSP